MRNYYDDVSYIVMFYIEKYQTVSYLEIFSNKFLSGCESKRLSKLKHLPDG